MSGDVGPYEGRRVAAAAVVHDAAGRVLLVRQGYGRRLWDLPAGAGNAGEPAQATAIRELREETGVDATARRLIGVYYEASTDTHDFVFVCVPDDPDFAPSPQPPETTDCGFFAHDDLPEPMSEFTRRRVRDAVVGAVPALPVTI